MEELAAQAGVRVDTVRYYQARGLLPAPRREGRIALYDDAHLARLRRIRGLLDDGLTLALIGRLFEREARGPRADGSEPDGSLLDAVVEEHVGARVLTREELARESGVPEALLAAARSAGLLEPLHLEDEERYSEADLAMARAGLAILGQGFPLHELVTLALDHARSVQSVTERAIDLFDDHVRKPSGDDPEAIAAVTDAFRTLLPQITRLVALHFQRTLVNRALHRLEERGANADLRAALRATGQSRLEVSVAWR